MFYFHFAYKRWNDYTAVSLQADITAAFYHIFVMVRKFWEKKVNT